jgi:shikimate kinase
MYYMKDVILTGPKNSGKTSAGKILASLCSCDFLDIDEFIFLYILQNPRQLYAENPEYFKKAEAGVIAALFEPPPSNKNDSYQRVIAAGGGLIDNMEACAIIKSSGAVVISLDISASAAWRRIANSLDGELPSFIDKDNPQESHSVLHERRSAAYREFANIVIKAEGKTPQEIASEIFYQLSL